MKLLLYHVLLLSTLGATVRGSILGLAVVVAFIPLVQTLPSPYFFLISAPNLMLLAVAGYCAKVRLKHEQAEPLKKYVVFWLVAQIVGLTIALARFPASAAETLINVWYWITPLAVFLLLSRVRFSRMTATVLVWAAFLSMFGECLIGVYERAQGVGRATAHLDEPNRAGAYFAGTAVLSLALCLRTKGKQQILFGLATVVAIGAVFASLSRGAMLATSLGGTVVFASFLLRPSQKSVTRKLLYLVIGIVVAANLTLLFPERVQERILFTFQQDTDEEVMEVDDVTLENLDGSAANRVQLWTWAIQLAQERPTGYGAFRAKQEIARFWGVPKAVHNIYLQVLVEYGVQGLIALLLLVFGVLKRLHGIFTRGTGEKIRTLALGLAGFWVAFCVAHVFVNPFFMFQVNGQFWVLLAVLCASANNTEFAVDDDPEGLAGPGEDSVLRVL